MNQIQAVKGTGYAFVFGASCHYPQTLFHPTDARIGNAFPTVGQVADLAGRLGASSASWPTAKLAAVLPG